MTEKKLKKQVDQLKRALQEKCAAYDQLKADVAGESPLQLADLLLCLFTLLLVWAVQCSAVQRIVCCRSLLLRGTPTHSLTHSLTGM